MEIGNELSQKIRGAIKARLVDLGSYVDDELPDYIMVMVANKKSKEQMTDDLNLFLGANTDTFTSWLHEVLSKLETATIGPDSGNLPDVSDTKAPVDKPPEVVPPKKPKKSKKSKSEKSGHHRSSKRSKDKDKDKDKSGSGGSGVSGLSKKASSDKVESPDKLHREVVAAPAPPSSSSCPVKQDDKTGQGKPVAQTAVAEPLEHAAKPVEQTEVAKPVGKITVAKPVAELSTEATTPQEQSVAEAVISLNPDTYDILDEEINQEVKLERKKKEPPEAKRKTTPSKSTPSPSVSGKSRTSPSVVSLQSPRKVAKTASSPPAVEVTKRTVEKTKMTGRVRTSSAGAVAQSTITVVAHPETSRKRKGPGSVIGQVLQADDDDDDDRPSMVGKRVASTIELQHRRPALPVSRQANTALLKKAVSAAEQSIKNVVRVNTEPVVLLHTRPQPTRQQEAKRQAVQQRVKMSRSASSSASNANKTLLVRAVHQATESTSSARRQPPPPASQVRQPTESTSSARRQPPASQVRQPTESTSTARRQPPPPASQVRQPTESTSSARRQPPASQVRQPTRGVAVYSTMRRKEMPKAGLVSRSRLREVAERDFDTQEFMTVEQGSVKMEEYYADDEDQEEDMETADSRHIFVEKTGGRPNLTRRSVDVSNQEMVYAQNSQESEVAMVIDSKPVVVDKHVVVKREKPPTPRPVSPRFIVTLDGLADQQQQQQGLKQPVKKQKAQKAHRAAARIAPRMDITRTIENSSMEPQLETEYLPVVASYHDTLAVSAVETEYVYVQSQLSPTNQQQPAPVFSPTSSSVTMAGDFEPMSVTGQYTLEEQAAVEQQHLLQQQQQQQQQQPIFHKQSPSERCRFWPACKNGNDCPYVHPSSACKTFPNCKFGDKCVFIHPNCKFDARCTKITCPFTHASKRGPSAPAPPPPRKLSMPPTRGPASQTTCKFFPKCVKVGCPFLHPRACRFGKACTRNDCMYTHPQVATGSALKWATGSALKWSKEKTTHISNRTFAVKSPEQKIQLG